MGLNSIRQRERTAMLPLFLERQRNYHREFEFFISITRGVMCCLKNMADSTADGAVAGFLTPTLPVLIYLVILFQAAGTESTGSLLWTQAAQNC